MWRGTKPGELHSNDHPIPDQIESGSTGSAYFFKRSFITTALNPKSIAFFVAFLPQFLDPLKPASPQLVTLGGTFLFLAVVNATLYALFAGRLSVHIKNRNVHKWLNRCGGSALIGAGIFTAGIQRTS